MQSEAKPFGDIAGGVSPVPLQGRKGIGRRADSLFGWLTGAAGLLVLVILAWMVISTTNTALPIFRAEGISFVTSSDWYPAEDRFGALVFIYGTLVTSAIALVLAVPISLGISLYLVEVAPKWIRGPLTYAVDLLAAVPSVVYGLWGVFVFLPLFLQPAADFLNQYLGWIPIFGAPASGLSYFGAGVVLAIMIIPIISSLSREIIATVPEDDRHAAYALGATRWEMIRGAIMPRARGGIIGAVMLGLGRALGETIAVALLVGSAVRITASVLSPGYSMAAVIANQFQEASGDHIKALVAVGVVLFVITIIVNVFARLIVWRVMRQ